MPIQIRHLHIRVVADTGIFGLDMPFGRGLNLIRAGNSTGKSTSIGSIVWALGLEGMLGPEHAIPLPHAMTSQIEDASGTERDVLESYVVVELERPDGETLSIRRHVTSDNVDPSLVRTWPGSIITSKEQAPTPTDYYVRRPGAAREERGFHRFLAEWSGWSLPEVPRFDGSSAPLYLEAIAPLWIVEQKRGWAAVQAQTPNYLQIREVRQRALEFVLNLDALDRRARMQELEKKLEDLKVNWREVVATTSAEAKTVGGVIRDLPTQPSPSWPPSPEASVVISRGADWVPLRQAARADAETVSRFDSRNLPKVTQDAELTQELENAESELLQAMAAGSQLRISIGSDEDALRDAESRLATIDRDRRRHQDLLLLRKLGSDEEAMIHAEECPVCHRDLGDVLLDEGDRERVMGVEETIDYLGTQADLMKTIIDSTTETLSAREAQFNALAQRSTELRSRLRALRKSLGGAGPTVAEVDAYLTAQHRLDRYGDFEVAFSAALATLSNLSESWRSVSTELKELRRSDLSKSDTDKLTSLEIEFIEQLRSYGFASFKAESMYLSRDSYLPTHEGYDPAFESSASDVIRIIWAYLLSLLHISEELDLNHPGLLIFDEPRQQMAHELSFRELLRRAASRIHGQVIFATSEDLADLANMLEGLEHNTMSFDGKVLTPIAR
jgi:hypothetical protein